MGAGGFIQVTDEGDSPGYFEADGEVTSMKLYAFGNVAQLQANVSGQTNPGGVRVIKSGTTSILEVKGPRVHGSINDHAEINILSYIDGTSKIALELYDSSAKITLSDTTGAPVVSVNGPTYFDNTVNVTGTITGNLTGNVTGNVSGTAATVTGAAQSNITSVGTLTGLTLGGNVTVSSDSTHDIGTSTACHQYIFADFHRATGNYLADNPSTGTGDDAEWAVAYGLYVLNRNNSLQAEKENISTNLESYLTASMIDDVPVKMFNRKHSPNCPEIGFIAEDMDSISPFLGANGTDENGDKILTGVNKTAIISLLVLALQDARARIAALES